MVSETEKTLFIISPIGSKGTEKWEYFNKVQRHIIRKVCEPLGYICERADDIDKPGIITSQIVTCIVLWGLIKVENRGTRVLISQNVVNSITL